MTEAELYTVFKGIYMLKREHTPQTLKYFEEFSFRPDDIIIATYPKSGTKWSQEIVPLIVNGGDTTCLQSSNWDRVPWLEHLGSYDLNFEERSSPRMFGTHLQYNMMPLSFFKVKPRIINVMRNPKDVFTSAIHYYEKASYHVNPGPQNKFLHKFLDGKVPYGSWFDHVKSWLNGEDKEHMMHISYEEMIMDLKDSVSRIAQFLEIPLDDEVIEKIADRCVFTNMKTNSSNFSLGPPEMTAMSKSEFMRKGIAGDWKNQLTVAEAEYFDAVYKVQMNDVKYKFVWD